MGHKSKLRIKAKNYMAAHHLEAASFSCTKCTKRGVGMHFVDLVMNCSQLSCPNMNKDLSWMRHKRRVDLSGLSIVDQPTKTVDAEEVEDTPVLESSYNEGREMTPDFVFLWREEVLKG